MSFFKNLEQLSKEHKLPIMEEAYFKFILHSNHKESIKQLQDFFPSFKLKKQKNNSIFISEKMPENIARAFYPYIEVIANENYRCLSFDSYSKEKLENLTFKDYVEHYQTCFLFSMEFLENYDTNDYYIHKKNIETQYLFGEQIFDSIFAAPDYAKNLVNNIYKGLSSVYHTDFIIKKNKETPFPVLFSSNNQDSLETLIVEIASILYPITSDEFLPEVVYGLPNYMLSHYLKPTRIKDRNLLIIISEIIAKYVQDNYSISKDFFVSQNENISNEAVKFFATDYMLLDVISDKKSQSLSYASDMIVKATPADNIDSLVIDLTTEITQFLWSMFRISSTFKLIKKAYELGLKENKTLLVMSEGSKEYINTSITSKELIEHTLKTTMVNKKSLSDKIQDFLHWEVMNSDDLNDEELDNIPVNQKDLDDIDD